MLISLMLGAGHGRRRVGLVRRRRAASPGADQETFRREFPGFDPFPFGVRSWIHGLVRHVLLADLLVDDFARCFQGVGSDEAARLADSFRFDACLKRERLLDILRSAATA